MPARSPCVVLAAGTELHGEFQGSGRTPAPFLIRRSDGRMLEVSPLLYLVAANLEGALDLDHVARRVSTAAARPVSAQSVTYLIDRKLRPLGIVAADPSEHPGPPAPERPKAVLGLAIRSAVVPAPAVRAAARLLRPLFLPPVIAAILLSVAVVDGWWFAHHSRVAVPFALLLEPTSLLIVISLTLAGAVFHELGHATASHYGGARPGVIGVGIYLLWPVLYNDLNDSYRLARRARLRADLGGVYFNAVFIVALATGYWLTGFRPLVLAIVVQHVAIAQQFLPFVRLDGYYVVSDLAGVPDLFSRIRPTMAALARGRRPAGALADLRPWARAIVSTWLMTTVPLLVALTVVLVMKMPSVLMAAYESLRAQIAMVVGATDDGDVIAALLHAVQALVLAVPFAGLTGVLWRLLLACRRSPARAVEHGSPAVAGPPAATWSRPMIVGTSLAVVVMCAVSRLGNRRQRAVRRWR